MTNTPPVDDEELRDRMLDEGYIPRAMQDDHGEMFEIPNDRRVMFADRLVELFHQYTGKQKASKVVFTNEAPEDKEWTAHINLLNGWTDQSRYLREIIQYARSGSFYPADMHVNLIRQIMGTDSPSRETVESAPMSTPSTPMSPSMSTAKPQDSGDEEEQP